MIDVQKSTAFLKDSAIKIGFFALAIAVLAKTPSHPNSIAIASVRCCTNPASTILGTFAFFNYNG